MAGLAEPGTSLISPAQGDWHWEVPEAGQYRYDPQRAKQILEDAGYADRDGDGVREDAAGDKLSFRLVALNEYPEDQAAAKMIVGWCRDVGIELRLDQMDEGAFSDEVYDNADYDLFIWSWGGDIDPGFMLSTFTTRADREAGATASTRTPSTTGSTCGRRRRSTRPTPSDTTQRKAITDEMQKILYRDDPYIVLWYNVNLQAFRTDAWTGYAPGAGRGRRAVLELHARHLHRPAPAADAARRRAEASSGVGVGRWSPRLRRGRRGGRRAPAPAAEGGGGRMTQPTDRPDTREDDA